MRLARFVCAAALPLVLAVTAGCTRSAGPSAGPIDPTAALRLVAFNSCDELAGAVKSAAKASMQPWGLPGSYGRAMFAEDSGSGARASAAGGGAPDHSSTNNHERGADEPDLVKTDGRRIVTVSGDQLSVIDAATKRRTGTLRLKSASEQLLLHGDKALVLSSNHWAVAYGADARLRPGMAQGTIAYLVDLAGTPKLVGTFEIDGSLVDARMSGGVTRVVVRSHPTIEFPWRDIPESEQLAANRKIIDNAPVTSWLPKYTLDGRKGQVDCADVSRPRRFSGTSMITVLSFDLAAGALTNGDPVSVLADADTIYGNGQRLYLAHDERWRGGEQVDGRTELFQFDVTGPRPVYQAAGSVPGWLLNQYSLSEHDGVLRAATTTGEPWMDRQTSESSVYTLRREGDRLKRIGEVGGLGEGERIYAVRFVGPTGYVVTFRQVDPLYTVDLSDPTRPKVMGELKIPGYSSYLHPMPDGRLIGVGQDANEQGRVQGMQVSIFDVAQLTTPRQVAKYHLPDASGEAEYDPHAFLYWPAERLLVLPVWEHRVNDYQQAALLLRIDGDEIIEIGRVSHGKHQMIRRSLVIGDTLWTVSAEQLMATSLDGKQWRGSVDL